MNKQITDFLNRNFHHPYVTKQIWTSYKEIDYNNNYEPIGDMCELLRVHSLTNKAHIKIYFDGVNESITIQMFLGIEWETFFEGYISTLNELIFIMDCIGVPYTE